MTDFVPNPRKAHDAVRYLLACTGEDVEREGVLDTPRRVYNAWVEMTSGSNRNPAEVLGTVFEDDCDQMVVVRNIRFSSLCEHHVLPFHGTITVGYIPSGKVVGLSKIPRLVEIFSKRLQMQERMTTQIAEALNEALDPIGVGVIARGHHACMGCRGVRQPDAEMVTSHLIGKARTDPSIKAELLALQ